MRSRPCQVSVNSLFESSLPHSLPLFRNNLLTAAKADIHAILDVWTDNTAESSIPNDPRKRSHTEHLHRATPMGPEPEP